MGRHRTGGVPQATPLSGRRGEYLTDMAAAIRRVTGARGRNEPTQLAAPAALTHKWPALTSLAGTPAYNVGRAYAAFAADLDNGTHTRCRTSPTPSGATKSSPPSKAPQPQANA
jgi:hypothetical protein